MHACAILNIHARSHVRAQEHWTTLCDMLAARLNAAGMHHPASLCYVCSGNVDAAVAYWAQGASGAATKVDALQVWAPALRAQAA